MVVVCRGFWRHGLMMWGIGGTSQLAEQFWRNAARWLVTRDDVERLRIDLDKEGYRSGEPVSFRGRLLDDLLAHATQEKYQYRHRWQKGDMVLWDNRCLLHKANGDYDHSQTRYLYRVMLKGTAPF